MIKYPSLYNLVRKKHASVAQVLSTTPLFQKSISGENWEQWLSLVGSILNERKDSFVWTANKKIQLKTCIMT
jgi:hypothetical protein